MKTTIRFLAVAAVVLLIATPAGYAQAPAPESSTLPVNEPLDVGGTILQPGTYVIRVVSPITDRHKVQITNVEGTKVFATLITVPHFLKPGEEYPNTAFVFYPGGEGQTRALRTWFPAKPMSGHGHDIVYEQSRAKQLARATNENVVSYTQQEAADLQVVTPQETVETYQAPAPEPVTMTTPAPAPSPEPAPVTSMDTSSDTSADTSSEMSSSTPMTSATPTDSESPEMPQTAGPIPLIALLGIMSLGAAAVVRRARRA